MPIPWLCVHLCPRLQFLLDRTHSFRISPNPNTKSVKENATKQPGYTNPETNPVNHQVFERKLRPNPSGRGHVCLGVTNRRPPSSRGYGTEVDLTCVTVRSNREEPSLKIRRLWRSNCSLQKRPQRRTWPKFPGKGTREGESPIVPGHCRTTRRETNSEQVPRGKDEKDFEKRVKECLKLSGGKRMGAGDSSRSDAERSNPVRRSIWAVARHGLSPGFWYARGDVAALIVVCSMRLTACLGICVLKASACGLPIRPVLKHGPRSLTCVPVNG
ncbi:hypothetical protein YC2023_072307 [Brassica napus]